MCFKLRKILQIYTGTKQMPMKHIKKRESRKKLTVFHTHPSLSKLNKSSVGIPSLAERLTKIQANMIRMSLPGKNFYVAKVGPTQSDDLLSLLISRYSFISSAWILSESICTQNIISAIAALFARTRTKH